VSITLANMTLAANKLQKFYAVMRLAQTAGVCTFTTRDALSVDFEITVHQHYEILRHIDS